ncbi:MAG: hypothetical protein J6K55_02950 [Clostridia bacterium]|nr:hypothetical protein [Clostridia bacterium]
MNTQLLKKRFEETPRMEPQDAVKLAFQSAFGCGHLLPCETLCTERIRREMDETPVSDAPVYTPIGNGLCRLNLSNAQVQTLRPEWIDAMMRLTDQQVRAQTDLQARFHQAVSLISALAHNGEAPFSSEGFKDYLSGYDGSVVRHTDGYREHYHPAYRVVLENCALLTHVLAGIQQGSSLIVFDGPCGSGKTTLAGLLGKLLGTVPVPMDDFFLPPDMRTPERLAQPGGNVHRERFLEEVLHSLLSGGDVRWRRFDCGTFEMHDRCLPKTDVTVIEGSYSHHPAFREAYEKLGALRVFVEVDAQEQLRRIGKRDPELLSMFQSRWIPLEKNYFEAYDIRGGADLVIQSPAQGEGRA